MSSTVVLLVAVGFVDSQSFLSPEAFFSKADMEKLLFCVDDPMLQNCRRDVGTEHFTPILLSAA